MITDDIYTEAVKYLKKEKIRYIKVPVIKYSQATIDATTHDQRTVLNTASKINVFNCHEFDKVVQLDADCMFLKNVDELFNYPDGAMYQDPSWHRGFVGLFVCTPRNHPIDYYQYLITTSSIPMYDGDLLESLWLPFFNNSKYQIPSYYFINITLSNFEDYRKNKSIYGIHFCYKFKPWHYLSSEDYFNDYEKELQNDSITRTNIVHFYINHYIIPLQEKYPELF